MPAPTVPVVVWLLASGLLVWSAPFSAVSAQTAEQSTGQSFEGQLSTAEGMQFFETHIRPLLARHCYACHSERAGKAEGELLLDRPAGWLQGGARGASVIPGKPADSLLLAAVRYEHADLEMPPTQPLDPLAIERLEQWIQLGAPGPFDSQTMIDDDPADPVAGRTHWAFQALTAPAIPSVTAADWCYGPIDRFVLSRLEQAGLQPNEDAPPQIVARRLALLLTGLPPTAELIAQLSSAGNASHDAQPAIDHSKLPAMIDHLLASPQFGERWGRHWLDLARYADSNGLDENFLFREAWRYRNWVINAVNADLPYNVFLTQQLAGDLLPYATLEQRDQQRIAAGFLVVGPKVLLGVPEQQQRMDVADEHIDTLGRAVLGQTLGCARCHDHKFDPIPTADYYALAGIFTSTQVMETRHMLGQQRLMEQLIGLGADGDKLDQAYEDYWREHPSWKRRQGPAAKAVKLLEENKMDELEKLRTEQPEAIAAEAFQSELSLEQRLASQRALVQQIEQVLSKPLPIPPRAMVPQDKPQPADEMIRLAGQHDAHGARVPRGFLTVLSDSPTSSLTDQHSGRQQLAQWLTDEHSRAGQLAARVLANRIWHHMLGRGLVRTVDNFGRTGEAPTHPDLLDYLAHRLISSGWSVKSLVREIASSHTFALSSRVAPEWSSVDPDNRWLWRAHRRRLEPEALRDAMLVAADALDQAQFSSTVDYLGDQATAVGENKVRRRTDFPCRSVYLPVIRNDLPEIFAAFDYTDPHLATGARPQTLVPAQGLFLLNDELVMTLAETTAKRLLNQHPSSSDEQRIDQLFALVCQASPTRSERTAVAQAALNLRKLLADSNLAQADTADSATAAPSPQSLVDSQLELRTWTLLCHALFASSRFQFVD